MNLKKSTLPNGWINCPKTSSLIADKFIVCKTFIDDSHDSQLPEEYRFNWKSLSSSVKSDHNKSIGLVIDLTNTDRFYNKSIVEEDGCQYVKIPCKGHGECPTPMDVVEFTQTVLEFQYKSPESLVCVHCTHGFNRSGFMIISYLCGVMRQELETSINFFASARFPGIYKEDYLIELSKKHGNGNEEFKTPGTPAWHNDNNFVVKKQENLSKTNKTKFTDKMVPNGDKGKDNSFEVKLQENLPKIKQTKFMDGMVPNVDNVNDLSLIQEIQSIVMEMCGWRDCRFSGSQPVSMDLVNISKLVTKSYRVSWKADGQRYMMLIKGRDEIYMLDRDFAVYKVNNLMFPRESEITEHIADTLLDGEMVIDNYPDRQRGQYLVYDIITFETQKVAKTAFKNRYACIEAEIMGPRSVAIQNNLLDRLQEPFGVSRKDFWTLEHARNILDGSFSKKLLHDSDGLIFQPYHDTYQFGQCNEILKWKPPELNTIDFKLIIEKQGEGCLGQLLVGGLKPSFAQIEITDQLMKYDNKIIECSWDFEKKVWKFMRERTDKSYPNKLDTARSIMKNIKNPLTKDYLYHVIDNQCFDLIQQNNENTRITTSNLVQKDNRSYNRSQPVPPVAPSNNTHISGLTFARLSNPDPFGLRKEVAILLDKFKRPKPAKKVINQSMKRQIDPLGLMDDIETPAKIPRRC